MEEDRRLSYFCLGLGIGVAVGLLFAPKSGAETREFLKAKSGEGKDYLKRRGEELRDQTSGLVERGKGALHKQREQFVQAVEAGKQAYRNTVSGAPAETPTES